MRTTAGSCGLAADVPQADMMMESTTSKTRSVYFFFIAILLRVGEIKTASTAVRRDAGFTLVGEAYYTERISRVHSLSFYLNSKMRKRQFTKGRIIYLLTGF
jgi:hypothetical protein